MATFSITVPDAQVARLVLAVATVRGVNVAAMTAAQKLAFIKADIRDYWIGLMTQVEVPPVASAAASSATTAQVADINANLTVS